MQPVRAGQSQIHAQGQPVAGGRPPPDGQAGGAAGARGQLQIHPQGQQAANGEPVPGGRAGQEDRPPGPQGEPRTHAPFAPPSQVRPQAPSQHRGPSQGNGRAGPEAPSRPLRQSQVHGQGQVAAPDRDRGRSRAQMVMHGYDPDAFFCEMLRRGAPPDPTLALLMSRLAALPVDSLRRRSADAERDLLERGITFTVYSDATAIDRILPFDLIPRVITAPEWQQIESGVTQRVRALNMFLYDVYHERRILADKVLPAGLVLGNAGYCQAMVGFDVPFNTYVHVCGTDIVRDETGRFRVLEDNARTPSGVAYVVENRHMSLRVVPDLMTNLRVRGVDEYGLRLHNAMVDIAPPGVSEPQVVVLSPGIFNAAYFEHVFLAREMGVPLVEGRDLTVEGGKVWMRTTAGLAPVHTIYRRINDDFLDPDAFNPDSALGVRGLIEAWRRGAVAIANAVGTGVADDKAIYAYMPRIIRYYLAEEPILPNVETRICAEAEGLAYTLDHLHELVVKPVAESGGYGLLIGPHATKAELDEFRARLVADPCNYISQPALKLSVSPTLCDEGVRPRHVDLRPFAVTGKDTWVLPGGLTRVALRAGTLVVNSSQGGGSKDTWVLA